MWECHTSGLSVFITRTYPPDWVCLSCCSPSSALGRSRKVMVCPDFLNKSMPLSLHLLLSKKGKFGRLVKVGKVGHCLIDVIPTHLLHPTCFWWHHWEPQAALLHTQALPDCGCVWVGSDLLAARYWAMEFLKGNNGPPTLQAKARGPHTPAQFSKVLSCCLQHN